MGLRVWEGRCDLLSLDLRRNDPADGFRLRSCLVERELLKGILQRFNSLLGWTRTPNSREILSVVSALALYSPTLGQCQLSKLSVSPKCSFKSTAYLFILPFSIYCFPLILSSRLLSEHPLQASFNQTTHESIDEVRKERSNDPVTL